ncbi:hypothetical protein N3K66_007584 [Trichothecium roseum]|uniref:Uncharacterized protein n=1 Tax=Trichothecium roseum TaxID=47278 RepID=A0ACC0UUR2_9HYPO|nr:hypothetical protein N3K66_007584 [Trichothecium roseum]
MPPLSPAAVAAVLVLVPAAAFLLLRLLHELLASPLRRFPGPPAARFTDLYRAAVTLRGRAERHHRSWHARYGPAVRVGPDAVLLSDPALIRHVYATKNAWLKTDFYRPNDIPFNGGRIHNLFNARDHAWYDHYKRPIGNVFSLSRVLEMEPLVDDTVAKFVRRIEAGWLSGGGQTRVVPMDEWLGYFAWDSICKITYGQHYGFIEQGRDVDGVIRNSKAGMRYFAPCSQIPWVDNYLDKNPYIRIGPRPMEAARAFSARVIVKYRAALSSTAAAAEDEKDEEEKKNKEKKNKDETGGVGGHLVERYFRVQKTYPDTVDDAQIANYALLSLGAGGDTTAAALRSALYLLAKSPVSYAVASAELDRAALPLPVRYADAQRARLPYLDACIRESMRLFPGVALAPEREVPPGPGFTLPDGRVLPAGTKVGINPAVVCRDEAVFGTRYAVDDFVPERWLRLEGESDEDWAARTKAMDVALDFTFGFGKRVCIGRNIAKLEIWKLMATLLTLFDIKLADPDHEWKCENYWFVYQSDMPMIITRKGSAKI